MKIGSESMSTWILDAGDVGPWVSDGMEHPSGVFVTVSSMSDIRTMSRLHLSSKSLPGVLEDMEILDGPVDGIRCDEISIRSVCESLIKIWHQKPCQDSAYPPSLLLDSRRTWTFLKNLEMVSDGKEHPSEGFMTVSSMSDIRNHVKTQRVLQVFSWSLGGHGQS